VKEVSGRGGVGTRVRELLATPRTGAIVTWLFLFLLMHLAFLLRATIIIDGALDTDVINFGLAAFRFDVLDHQPHPPGYPGYVLMLKGVRWLAPELGPIEVAVWGCRLTGVLTIPAAYWACRQALALDGGGADRADLRPFAAAGLAVVHPLLWYYGGDGQSHGVEAMATLLLFGGALKLKRSPRLAGRLALVAAAGLAGSLRPTISVLALPFLLWCFWRRPIREWLVAGVVGVVAVAAWWVPLVQLTGGWDLYNRAEKALVYDLFISRYSVFGAQARLGFVTVNVLHAVYSILIAAIPLLGLGFQRSSWLRPWWTTILANFAFYALVYIAESGYLTGVAGLACLVPATWPAAASRHLRLRAAGAYLVAVTFMLLGPADLKILYWNAHVPAPTLAHVVRVEEFQRAYRSAACASPDGRPIFVVTDNPVTTHTRLMPVVCPGVILGIYLYANPLNRALDNWLIFYAEGMDSLPTEVPLEVSSKGATLTLRHPVAWVEAAPDASTELQAILEQTARCPSLLPMNDEAPRFWPARCLPTLAFGASVVRVPSVP
jgi:hypothetical protein